MNTSLESSSKVQLSSVSVATSKESLLSANNATAIYASSARWIILIMRKVILKKHPKKLFLRRYQKTEKTYQRDKMRFINWILSWEMSRTRKLSSTTASSLHCSSKKDKYVLKIQARIICITINLTANPNLIKFKSFFLL